MSGNPHPWRIMAALFGGVLLSSYGLDRLLAPAGDALARAADERHVTIAGTIAKHSAPGGFALYDGRALYALSDQTRAGTYLRRKVLVTGVLHRSTGTLDIESIRPVGSR